MLGIRLQSEPPYVGCYNVFSAQPGRTILSTKHSPYDAVFTSNTVSCPFPDTNSFNHRHAAFTPRYNPTSRNGNS